MTGKERFDPLTGSDEECRQRLGATIAAMGTLIVDRWCFEKWMMEYVRLMDQGIKDATSDGEVADICRDTVHTMFEETAKYVKAFDDSYERVNDSFGVIFFNPYRDRSNKGSDE